MFFKTPKQRSQKHLAFVRTLPCVKCGITNYNDGVPANDPAHLRKTTDAGGGQRPSDIYVNPLCHIHHDEQHTKGEVTFWRNVYAAKDLAQFIWQHTGDRETCAREIIRRRGELF